jgi:hypothetical protein
MVTGFIKNGERIVKSLCDFCRFLLLPDSLTHRHYLQDDLVLGRWGSCLITPSPNPHPPTPIPYLLIADKIGFGQIFHRCEKLMDTPAKVLLVDDEPGFVNLCKHIYSTGMTSR